MGVNFHGLLSSALAGQLYASTPLPTLRTPHHLTPQTRVLIKKLTVSQPVVQKNQLSSVSISGQDSQLTTIQVSETLIGHKSQLI